MVDIRRTINDIVLEIIGKIDYKEKIIRVNSDDNSIEGDLWFPSNLLAWRDLITPEHCGKSIKDILEYYSRRKEIEIYGLSGECIAQKAIDSLITASENWEFRVETGCLRRERVCLFLNRALAIKTIISETIKHRIRLSQKKKTIFFAVNEDLESNLTTFRLEKLKSITENILKLRGYEITKNSPEKYLLTTKSQGMIEDGYRKYVCGVVKNPESNGKEISETRDSYLCRKIKGLEEVNEGRDSGGSEARLKRIAEAILTFEMLGVRPSRPGFIGVSNCLDKSIASTKSGAFVLYNVARIEAICRKFEDEYGVETRAGVENVDRVDFSRLSSEEEWNLVYNFILAYPQVLMNSVCHGESLELCPQLLCTFLSHLSQKFSVYYRRTRILTEEREHLISTMTARLCLLKALSIVYHHALEVLEIVPLLQM